MSFVKLSQTQRLAYWEDGQAIHRTAAMERSASYFAEPQHTTHLDVGEMLQKVAAEYDISANPKDYLFEAVRAVTSGVPNENGDAFHKNELLRYDHRLRQAVYQTFILKPHHVNHRADNPKTARGVILDAHYNDATPALEICPKDGCGNRTASMEGRDSTGLYCRKCGSTVKDEFVEILIAVDKHKDPNFAEGVRNGVLNATSMGCVCDSTTCNVCDHIAYNRNEFCNHIRGGNKKKTFKTAAGEKIAFEWCNNVCFTEDSRVDQPADPKALQQEILSLAARKEAMVGDLSRETDMLIMQKQINELQARVAQMAPPQQMSPEVAPGEPAVSAQPGSIEQFVQEQDTSVKQDQPMSKEEMGILESPAVSADGGMGTKASVSTNIYDELDDLAQRYASQHSNSDEGAKMELKFKTAYSNVRAAITSRGNCRVYTPAGTLFVIQPTEPLRSAETRKAFATTVLGHIAEHGLVPTIRAFEAAKGVKLAQILEHHLEDFAGGRKSDGKPMATNPGMTGMDSERGEPEKSQIGDQTSDRKDMVYEKKTMNDSMLGGHQEDFEGKNREDKSFPGTVQDQGHMTQKDQYPKKNLSDSPLDGVTTDHQRKIAAEEGSKPPSASKPSASKPSASKPSASKPSSSKSSAGSKPASKGSKPPSKEGAPTPPAAGAPPPAAAAPAPVPGAPAAAPAAPPAMPGAGAPGAMPGMDGQGVQQHWVAIEAMIAEMTAAGLPPEVSEKAKQVAATLASGAASPGMEQAMSELEAMLPQIMEGMATPDNAIMLMDQMLAPAAPEQSAPPMGGAPVTASKKGLPSFIKNKRGGSGSTSKSKPSVSSKERANSEGGHGSKKGMVKESALKDLELRMERLYKGRIAKLKEETQKREAALTDRLAGKFKRALKLAAKRQALNLEMSPIKAAFADVLLNPHDLGGGEFYPGMDEQLATTLIEKASALGMDEFVDKVVDRAAELMKTSDETFGHIEADLKNLQPVMPAAQARADAPEPSHKREAARNGNMQLAAAPSEAPRHDRTQLQAALGGTKVQRQHGRTFNS
jgi:hypothetical protein